MGGLAWLGHCHFCMEHGAKGRAYISLFLSFCFSSHVIYLIYINIYQPSTYTLESSVSGVPQGETKLFQQIYLIHMLRQRFS